MADNLAADQRLDSWKEIAAYLKRDITTVQRWERREAMPVHRHQHDKLGSVYAFRSELDAWTSSRKLGGPTQPGDIGERLDPARMLAGAAPRRASRAPVWTAGVLVLLALSLMLLWFGRRTEYLLAQPDCRRAVPAHHGLGRRRAGRRDFA